MAKDPICDMTVDEATGLRAERDGQIFYFCSEYCRQKFLAQPATVASGPQIVPLQRLHHAQQPHPASPHSKHEAHLAESPSCCANGTASKVKHSPMAKYL